MKTIEQEILSLSQELSDAYYKNMTRGTPLPEDYEEKVFIYRMLYEQFCSMQTVSQELEAN